MAGSLATFSVIEGTPNDESVALLQNDFLNGLDFLNACQSYVS